MNRLAIAAVLAASSTLFASCASLPPTDAPKTRVSADYEAAGDASGVRAFVYGKRTVLEVGEVGAWFSVRDENGVAVAFEREGRYVRLSRKLDRFSVWMGARAIAFNTITPVVATAAPTAPAPAASTPSQAAPDLHREPAVRLTAMPKKAELPADDADALLRISELQLAELRRAMAGSTPVESRELSARLDRIDAQLTRAATAVVRVQFATARTEFDPASTLAQALLPAAKAAERINVRGRTDARQPDNANARIALARALAARQYLVEHGVDGAKIKVFSLPAGDFVAPAGTREGMALNRRVDIELVNKHYVARAAAGTTVAEVAQ